MTLIQRWIVPVCLVAASSGIVLATVESPVAEPTRSHLADGSSSSTALTPAPVSPGAVERPARVGSTCPTFSWSFVDNVQNFELVVYAVGEEGDLPVLDGEVYLRLRLPRGATSWTPSLDECFEPGGRYAWVVGAIFDQGEAHWSEARLFQVAADPTPQELAEAVELVRRYLGDDAEIATAVPGSRPGRPDPGDILAQLAPAAIGEPNYAAAVRGELQDTSGISAGVYGVTNSVHGRGVFGVALNGSSIGVWGESHSTAGEGVVGYSVAGSGGGVGVLGQSNSPDGFGGVFYGGEAGVYARSTGSSGPDLILGGNSSSHSGDDGRIWSDPFYSGSDIWLESNDEMIVRLDRSGLQDGHFSIRNGFNATIFQVDESGNVTTTGALAHGSDRNSKEGIVPVDAQVILEQVASLEIARWRFRDDVAGGTHLGPMSQDFRAAFGLGTDERHIATIDADGVALAAIQGLYKLVREQQIVIEQLRKTVADDSRP